MCNLADALMNVLELFFNDEKMEYPTEAEIVQQIQWRYKHLDIPTLASAVRIRLHSLVDYKILRRGKKGRLGAGPRWCSMPVDQLEEE